MINFKIWITRDSCHTLKTSFEGEYFKVFVAVGILMLPVAEKVIDSLSA